MKIVKWVSALKMKTYAKNDESQYPGIVEAYLLK